MMSSDNEQTDDDTIAISCGNITGKLHRKSFLCPGIRQRCIETEDGDYVTPKAFSVLGEKEKLKDWKNAIRIDGKSIRKKMDSGQLDFYRHDEVCTGRCASRNGGLSKYELKIESLNAANSSVSDSGWDLPSTFTPIVANLNEPAYDILREVQGDSPENSLDGSQDQATGQSTSYSKALGEVVFPSPVLVNSNSHTRDSGTDDLDPGNLVIKEEPIWDRHEDMSDATQVPVANVVKPHRRKPPNPSYRMTHSSSIPSITGVAVPYLVNGKERDNQAVKPTLITPINVVQMVAEFPDTENLLEDSTAFWNGIKNLGLLEEFVRDTKHALDSIKMDMIKEGVKEVEAKKLSNVVTDLGLVTKLKWRIAEHRSRTEREKAMLNLEIEALKRKVQETEERQQQLKRKSECFIQLIESTKHKKPKDEEPKTTPASKKMKTSSGSKRKSQASSILKVSWHMDNKKHRSMVKHEPVTDSDSETDHEDLNDLISLKAKPATTKSLDTEKEPKKSETETEEVDTVEKTEDTVNDGTKKKKVPTATLR